jgi:flavin-dependent dehydrogenase
MKGMQMISVIEPDVDVAIIGGGPAGASMGAYLAKAGVRCTVFEGELFPRPHVGESLVPSSTRVFKELGFLDQMEAARFPRKYGAVWTAPERPYAYAHDWGLSAESRAEIRFDERSQPGVDQPYTYHVDRGKFDTMLLQHAHALGAAVCEGVRVTHVDFSEPLPRVHFRLGEKAMSVTSRIVVDASGRHTLLGNQLKLKARDPVFDQYAIHTWFGGYDRGAWTGSRRSQVLGIEHTTGPLAPSAGNGGRRPRSLEDDFICVHFLPISNSWIWQIPIDDDITSIGVVTQKKNFAKSKQAREEFYWNCVATRPEIEAALRQSERLRPLKDEGDYSYAMTQLTGDRFMLVGDAGRFVDPIFSTGVSIALNSSRFGSRDILSALETGDCSRAAFANFEETIRRGTRNWYEFISVYYRLNVIFTAFVLDPRYRLDTLKLLQGDVYDEERPEVLRVMQDLVTHVETHPDHVWHAMLGELTSHAFSPPAAAR